MALEIKGKVHEVGKPQQVTEKMKKQEFVLEVIENPQYPEYIKFEAIQDRCKLLDELRPGDEVEVHFNLRGRPYTDKTGKKTYFNSLGIWKINILKTTPQQTYTPPADDDGSDLPF